MNIREKTTKAVSKALTLATIALFFALRAEAQVAVAPLQLARQQFLSSTGVPLANGCIDFFATGTSTRQAIYADSGGVFQLANPLQLDVAGEASVWMSNTGYDIAANTGVNNTLCSVSEGTQLWKEINKNPFSIINGGSNYIVASGTVDPSGSAGMLAFRSDLPCLRFFISTWDCIVELTLTQTLTNKTLDISANTLKNSTNTAGHYPRNNGTQYVDSAIQTGDVSVVTQTYVNYSPSGGTGTNLLAAIGQIGQIGVTGVTNVPISGLIGGVPATAIGVCITGCSVTGIAPVTLVTYGQVQCVFDNASSAGDYVVISTTVAGNCHDFATGIGSYPTSGQVVGRVVAGNLVAAGLNTIEFFGAEVKGTGTLFAPIDLTARAANIGSTAIITPTANGFYRPSCYIVLTQVATTSSTLPVCSISWTDADTSVVETVTFGVTTSANTLGLLISGTPDKNPFLYAKTGVAINYSTSGYASVGGTPMQYAVHLRLEGPF